VRTGKSGDAFQYCANGLPTRWKTFALHGIKSNVCPKCKLLAGELGTDPNSHRARDYARHQVCERESDDSGTMFETLGIDPEKKVLHRLRRVSAPGLHQPELLHVIYLALFKHLIDSISGFLKKHTWLQPFDDTRKALPPYTRFFVLKKVNDVVTQWQGKQMRKLEG